MINVMRHRTTATPKTMLLCIFPLISAFWIAGCIAENRGTDTSRIKTAETPKETFPSCEFASVVKGTSVYEKPSRASGSIGTIPFGTEVEIFSIHDERYKEVAETWANVRWGDIWGWSLRYYFRDSVNAPETSTSIEGQWKGYYNNHFLQVDFMSGGECKVEFCPASGEVYGFMTSSEPAPDGYTWSQSGDDISVWEVFDKDKKYLWQLARYGRYRLEGEIGLYRISPFREAVMKNDMTTLYTLLANDDFFREDPDYNLYVTEKIVSDKTDTVNDESDKSKTSENRGADESAQGNEYGYAHDCCMEEGSIQPQCDCPDAIRVLRMPLVATALSEKKYQAAMILLDHDASPDAYVENIGLGTSEPMLFHFLLNKNIYATGFLYNNGSRLEVTDSRGRTLNDIYADMLVNGEKRYVDSASGIDLFDTPTATGKIIASIPVNSCVVSVGMLGEEAPLFDKMKQWMYIMWEGKSGWVSGNNLRVSALDTISGGADTQ
jgi:hypothetical protein